MAAKIHDVTCSICDWYPFLLLSRDFLSSCFCLKVLVTLVFVKRQVFSLYCIPTIRREWAQIFTGLLFYAYADISEKTGLWQLPTGTSVFNFWLNLFSFFVHFIFLSTQTNMIFMFVSSLSWCSCFDSMNNIKTLRIFSEDNFLGSQCTKFCLCFSFHL